MARPWKIAGAVLVVIVAALVAFAFLFDWNTLKPYVERKVTEKTGREFTIKGDLDVDLGLNPLITAQGLTLANAPWGTRQPMVTVDNLAFRVNLWRLIRGEIVLPEVSASHPNVIIERSKDGKANWELTEKHEEEGTAPKIGRLSLDQGTVVIRLPASQVDVTVDLTSEAKEGGDVREAPINFKARGTFKGLKLAAQGQGGAVVSLADPNLPYPIRADAQIGTTRGKVNGTITGVAVLAAMNLDVDLQGDDLSALYPILGVVLFPSPPYRISGKLVHEGDVWNFNGFKGKVGNSDLGGTVRFDTGGKRPKLSGDLVSTKLDLTDLEGFIGPKKAPRPEESPAEKARKAESARRQSERVLPDEEYRLDRLRAMDADVTFKGKSIINEKAPVDELTVHLKVNDGLLTLDPLDFGVAGGRIASKIAVNGRHDVPVGEGRIEVSRLHLDRLFPGNELMKTSRGLIGGRLEFKGSGKSFGGLLGSTNGRATLLASGGQIDAFILELLELDGAQILKYLFSRDTKKTEPLRCGVLDFPIKNGIAESEIFVVDTEDTIVLGGGQIDLKNERLNLTLTPRAKHASILSLRSPIHIVGTFKKPGVRPDKTLVLRAGATLVAAVLAPVAALIPLVETGPGKDANCQALIEEVKQKPADKPTAGRGAERERAARRGG
ncbi:MAG: AsmA family protein [Rhodospirillaceae bacterium]